MKSKKTIIAAFMVLTVIILMITDGILTKVREDTEKENIYRSRYEECMEIISSFAANNNLGTDAYPEKIIEMLIKNPETEEFVLNYPLKKDNTEECSLEEYKNTNEIPHLLQWDMRWGYKEYAGDIMALSGCGPVCLSMVAIYLTGNTELTPGYIAEFAEREGYASKNNGTLWLLMSEGAQKLGLTSKEIPLHKNSMINALREGSPLILIMKPGDFTTEGHFIVITDYSDEGFSVLDPNSEARSSRKWTYEKIENQINNIWAFSFSG